MEHPETHTRVTAPSVALHAVTDPVTFSRVFLKADPWPMQQAIMRAVATDRRVAVKACHSSGKTYLAASVLLWWITRHRDGLVVTTAPTWLQVAKLLWGEVHTLLKDSRLSFPVVNTTEIKTDNPKNYALGLSTNEGVRFQGFHGSKLLVILDEAPGVMGDIWDAIEGIRAGGDVTVLVLGNPVIASGPFYDAFTTNRDGWRLFTISAFDTPNLDGLDLDTLLTLPDDALTLAPRPYLTRRSWVREKFHEWGPGHPLWQSRVLGEFPDQPEDALLSLSWIEQAKARPFDDRGDVVDAGLDVAGPGEDETVLVLRCQNRVILERWWADSDPRGGVMAALRPYRDRLRRVAVDCVGIGWGMFTHLQGEGLPAVAVNVGEASSDAEQYANLKAELYWGLRQRFQAGDIAGDFSEAMVRQLCGIRYKHNPRGQVAIESKDDARKRGVKSPDRAEALMLAFAPVGTGTVQVTGAASTFGATPRRIDRMAMPR